MVNYFVDAGVKGLYLCGSTGSGIAMTMAERKLMVAESCKANAGRIPVIVMVGACPVDEAVELALHAKEVRPACSHPFATSTFNVPLR
jgi:N-acetylneuraminate lyase